NRALSGAQRSRNVLDPSRADAIDGGAVLVLVAAWVSAAVLIANHVSSGGNPFGRYVLVWLPIVACLVGAVPLLFRRPVVAAGVAGVLVGLYVRHSFKVLARFHTTLQVRFAAAENSALRRAVGPEWSQHFAHGAANVSAIVLVVLTVVAVHRAMKPHHDGLPETSGTEAVH
ncbi:MAG: hypothetical protein KDB02_12760, partial [Acidimicrobiales bacterium]|nr:hypothetical protein [Acidimicrobiales bacterium]